ncbi:MAG: hypothetical protein DMG17_14660 [Acidobacteria bacterium]|nr:MAG: hypothetical protein DMG17_14660 [Acidobacteriota bacterium]
MNVFLSLLLLFAPVKVEQGRFTIFKDGKRMGTEEFSVARRGSGYVVEGKTTIGNDVISSQMELNEKLSVTSYRASSREGSIQLKVTPPVSELQSIVQGETSTADFRFPEGGVILDNNFFHHYLILLYRVQAGQSSFSVFVPHDLRVGAATVRAAGPRTYDLEVGEVKLQATIEADGSLTKLTVPAANVVVQR